MNESMIMKKMRRDKLNFIKNAKVRKRVIRIFHVTVLNIHWVDFELSSSAMTLTVA